MSDSAWKAKAFVVLLNVHDMTFYFLIVDAMYEGFKKRTFVAAALLATLHLPFLVEIIVLYKKLGPRYAGNEPRYTKLLINADTND